MFSFIKIAWRNLWRNKRRTSITSASIFFGIFLSVFMTSLQTGSFEKMVDNMVRLNSGYLQIQQKEYKDKLGVNYSFELTDSIKNAIAESPLITQKTERIQTFALAASDSSSFGAIIFGIIPETENAISNISKWVSSGNFITSGSQDIMVGKMLAENLKIGVNDTLVLLGQGYHGVSAVGKYRVAALLDFPIDEISKTLIYIDLPNCQDLYSLQNRITNEVLMVTGPENVERAKKILAPQISGDVKLYSWDELQPELVNLIEGKLASGKFIKSLLFIIIGFGVWSTIIMLMAERKREFGVMMALGMKKLKLAILLILESVFIAILGVVSGIVLSFPLVFYFYVNPIRLSGEIATTYSKMGFEPVLDFGINPEVFLGSALIISIIFILIIFYQIWYLYRLKTTTALKA